MSKEEQYRKKLDRLDEQTIKKLQSHPLIVQLSEFLQKIPLKTPIPT